MHDLSKLWIFKMLYLASGSPRRKRLLAWFGLDFEVVENDFDEESVEIVGAEKLVGELSLQKAYGGLEKIKGKGPASRRGATASRGGLVIGSDLVIEYKGKIYGKAKDLDDGRKTLKELRDKTHTCWCGVAVVDKESQEAVMSVSRTKVKMKNYPDEIIDEYVKKMPVTDRAGAYGVQDELKGYGSLVEKFDGGITTIIGLPMDHLENLLKEFGVKANKDWRKKCKQETGYEY